MEKTHSVTPESIEDTKRMREETIPQLDSISKAYEKAIAEKRGCSDFCIILSAER